MLDGRKNHYLCIDDPATPYLTCEYRSPLLSPSLRAHTPKSSYYQTITSPCSRSQYHPEAICFYDRAEGHPYTTNGNPCLFPNHACTGAVADFPSSADWDSPSILAAVTCRGPRRPLVSPLAIALMSSDRPRLVYLGTLGDHISASGGETPRGTCSSGYQADDELNQDSATAYWPDAATWCMTFANAAESG